MPKKYEGEELALIETPGKSGNFKARIIGTITFSHCFEYPDQCSWQEDFNRHLVEPDSEFGRKEGKKKYGWVVSDLNKFEESQPAPNNKGIIFTNNCQITIPSGV